ncbi:unnamed protein product [Polarella glacialis]|uniref:Uncharacterized protein n=1 Tax=Polarella glacialis TaxID=89957 RepID=A0A813JTK3_POLGL|nr:unnamed protein product [Polarella glacialis]
MTASGEEAPAPRCPPRDGRRTQAADGQLCGRRSRHKGRRTSFFLGMAMIVELAAVMAWRQGAAVLLAPAFCERPAAVQSLGSSSHLIMVPRPRQSFVSRSSTASEAQTEAGGPREDGGADAEELQEEETAGAPTPIDRPLNIKEVKEEQTVVWSFIFALFALIAGIFYIFPNSNKPSYLQVAKQPPITQAAASTLPDLAS